MQTKIKNFQVFSVIFLLSSSIGLTGCQDEQTASAAPQESNYQKLSQDFIKKLGNKYGHQTTISFADKKEDGFNPAWAANRQIYLHKKTGESLVKSKNVNALYFMLAHEYAHLLIDHQIYGMKSENFEKDFLSVLKTYSKTAALDAYMIHEYNVDGIASKIMKDLKLPVQPGMDLIMKLTAALPNPEGFLKHMSFRKKIIQESYKEGWASWNGYYSIYSLGVSKTFRAWLLKNKHSKILKAIQGDFNSKNSSNSLVENNYSDAVQLTTSGYIRTDDPKNPGKKIDTAIRSLIRLELYTLDRIKKSMKKWVKDFEAYKG